MRTTFINWRGFNWGCLASVLASLAVWVGIVVGVIALHHHARHAPRMVPSVATRARPSDELSRELARCQAIGGRAEDDRDCIAAWRENRRRFFGGGAVVLRSAPSPAATTEFKSTSHP